MTPDEIRFVCDVFGLSPKELGRALGVARCTIPRWARRGSPSGLHRSVLRALHEIARIVKDDHKERMRVRNLLALGVEALLVYAIMGEPAE